MTKPVVTYKHAYHHSTVDLCDACVDAYSQAFPLGPVERGRHEGTCALCDARRLVEKAAQPSQSSIPTCEHCGDFLGCTCP